MSGVFEELLINSVFLTSGEYLAEIFGSLFDVVLEIITRSQTEHTNALQQDIHTKTTTYLFAMFRTVESSSA